MSTITNGLAIAAVVAGAAVALAATASAEPISGTYTGVLTDGSGQVIGSSQTRMGFSPCGPDCVTVKTPGPSIDLRLQGANYVGGYDWQGAPCTMTLDTNALVFIDECPNDPIQRFALTKVG